MVCLAVPQPPLCVEVLQRRGGGAIHRWLGRRSQELQVLLHHRTHLSLHCPLQPLAIAWAKCLASRCFNGSLPSNCNDSHEDVVEVGTKCSQFDQRRA